MAFLCTVTVYAQIALVYDRFNAYVKVERLSLNEIQTSLYWDIY